MPTTRTPTAASHERRTSRRSRAVTDREWERVHHTLRDVFGLDAFRPGQEEVIRAVLAGRDTLALMPTGAGKSLCYQIPGLRRKGTTIVVSPLISLMRDQAGKLETTGISAAELHSALPKADADEANEKVRDQASEFVLVTPERLADPGFLDTLREHTIDLVVVDEAHCVSQWGHDFRPSYLAIRDAVAALGRPPVLALTATAPPDVARDIVEQLAMRDVVLINTGVYRPNLHYEVVAPDHASAKEAALLSLLRTMEGPGIVYCATVRHVDELSKLLPDAGIQAVHYHGRLAARLRGEHQQRFMSGEVPLMIATNAFGMGIDKPDIRFVVHFDLPPSLDAYYQESGRAGRDDRPSRCVLIFHKSDRKTPLFFMSGRYPSADDLMAVHAVLAAAPGDGGLKLAEVQAHAPVPRTKVRVALTLLKDADLAVEHRGARFELRVRDISRDRFQDLARDYEARREADRERLDRMVAWAQSARCRWEMLLEYFESDAMDGTCSTCDNCRSGRSVAALDPAAAVRIARSAPAPALPVPTEAPEPRLMRGLYVDLDGFGRVRIEDLTDDTVTVLLGDGRLEQIPRR